MMSETGQARREQILNHGLNLLGEVGLSGITLGLLAADVGMSKSGLFAHFRSKEAVQIALLRQMAHVANASVVAPALRAGSGLPRLTTLVEHWLGWTSKAGLRGGCPVAAALFELDDVEGEVREEVLAMERRWRGLLGQLTREVVEHGAFCRDLDVEQFVWELCGIYLSHHASNRFLRDPRSDSRARSAFAALLCRAQPVPDTASALH